jgi:hypothetical protein
MEGLEKLQFCYKFNRTKGDIRCCAYIYNLAVQAALKTIKAEGKEGRYYYKHIAGQAYFPNNDKEHNTFYKIQSLAMIFKKYRFPQQEL